MSKPVRGPRANDLKLQKMLDDVVLFAVGTQLQWDTDTCHGLIHRGITLAALGHKKLRIRIKQIKAGHGSAGKKLEKILNNL